MSRPYLMRAAGALLCAGALALAGCDSDSSNPGTSTIITGTAATGAPVASATVNLRCSGGTTATATTSATGTWSVTVPTASLPCAVQIDTGVIELYAFTIGSGGSVVTNLSPLTSLAIAGALGAAPDDAWFDSLNDSGLQTLGLDLTAALTALGNALQAQGYTLPSGNFTPFTTSFEATAGNAWDDLLEALKAALDTAGTDLPTLLASYAGGGDLPLAGSDGGGGGDGGTGGSITTGYASSPSFSPKTDGFTITTSGADTIYQFSNVKLSGSVEYSHVLSLKVDAEGGLVDVNYTDARDLGFTTSIVCGSAYGVSCTGLVVTPGTQSVTVTFTEAVLKVRSGITLGVDTTFNGTLTGVAVPAT